MYSKKNMIPVYGYGGDPLMAPEHTEISFWAALGGGADGLASEIRMLKDNTLICVDRSFADRRGNIGVIDMTWEELQKVDAGSDFRSTVLDAEGQPTGKRGYDTPWAGSETVSDFRPLRFMSFDRMLAYFARRCRLFLLLPPDNAEIVKLTVEKIKQYGALDKVSIIGVESVCRRLPIAEKNADIILLGNKDETPEELALLAKKLNITTICHDIEEICKKGKGGILFDDYLKNELENNRLKLLLKSGNMPFAPAGDYLEAMEGVGNIIGMMTKGVLPTVEKFTPKALVAEDIFAGNQINKDLWAAGYSHINQDTTIYQDNGLHIDIKDGGSYSGAAGVCKIPLHGRFDVQVDFEVANPSQGTTFEIAAICIDPGYDQTDNAKLDTRNVNLTFDVHGAPPYASSERDEDDGFRCGWNNGFNLTKIADNWEAASANMYNKYGRDVGSGKADNPAGTLRLIRNGPVFSTYYKDRFNENWVCSGAVLVPNMSEDVYVRIAAKHWNKTGHPPYNKITFGNFKVYQF